MNSVEEIKQDSKYFLPINHYEIDGSIKSVVTANDLLKNSENIIGLKGIDGVVLVAEKPISSLNYVTRIENVSPNIGMVTVTGCLSTDKDKMAKYIKSEYVKLKNNTNLEISLDKLSNRVASHIHSFTINNNVKPLETAIIFASYNEKQGPLLYAIRPSGDCYPYFGIAFGKDKNKLEEKISKNISSFQKLSMKQLAKESIKLMYEVNDKNRKDFEMAWIGDNTNGKFQVVPEDIVNECHKYAENSMGNSANMSNMKRK